MRPSWITTAVSGTGALPVPSIKVAPTIAMVEAWLPGTFPEMSARALMGVDRLALLKYGVDDLQYFFQGDVRFLQQFG